MPRRKKQSLYNKHMDIPHYTPSSQHDDVTYHPLTRECVFIPQRLRSPERFREITQGLDEPVGEFTDPFTDTPITTYQFLSVWTKFAPAQYHTSYFLRDANTDEWYMDKELIITVQTALEKLQAVITDVIAVVGEERYPFMIDREGKLSEQLWTARKLKELMTADKLLKLRVELTFTRLLKLRRLHEGETLNTPMASDSSLPPTPDLAKRLHSAWSDPRLHTKNLGRRAVSTGWEAIQADLDGSRPIERSSRHPFSGHYAMKYHEYDGRVEEALDVQPVPRMGVEPYGLGMFLSPE